MQPPTPRRYDADGTVTLWDVPSGKRRLDLPGKRGAVTALAFTPDGKALAVAGGIPRKGKAPGSGGVAFHDPATGKLLRTLDAHDCLWCAALSPDGRLVAAAGEDRAVRLWELPSGRLLHTLRGPTGLINAVAFSPDSQTLAAGGGCVFKPPVRTVTSSGAAGVVQAWDVATGRPRFTYAEARDHGGITCLAFSPDGRWLASLGEEQSVRVWSAEARPRPTPADLLAWDRHEAERAYAAGRWFAAASHLGPLVDSEPREWRWPSRRAFAYARLGRWDRAESDAGRAIDSGADEPFPWYVRGCARVQLGRRAGAIADLTRALKDNPDNPSALAFRGRAFAEMGSWAKAAADLGNAARIGKPDPDLLLGLALARLKAGDPEGYSSSCRALLEHSQKVTDVDLAVRITWACCASPDSKADPLLLLDRLAGAPQTPAERARYTRARGIALLRTGKADDSRHWLDHARRL